MPRWRRRTMIMVRTLRLGLGGYGNFLRQRTLPNDDTGIVAVTVRRNIYFLTDWMGLIISSKCDKNLCCLWTRYTCHEKRYYKKSPRGSMVEQLICNQRVGGSTPSVGSSKLKGLAGVANPFLLGPGNNSKLSRPTPNFPLITLIRRSRRMPLT